MATTIDPKEYLRPLDQEVLNILLNDANPPCVSIYMPTQRRGPETRENPIRFKSLLQKAQQELGVDRIHPNNTGTAAVLKDLEALIEDNDFWQHQLDGLAVFVDQDKTILVRIPRPVGTELSAVADSFHVKPLIRVLQSPGRYRLLAITQKNVTLYEGDVDQLDVIPLHPDVPRTLIEAIGGEVRGELNVNHYGGLAHSGMFHGHHDNKDDRDQDLERFFRVIDKAIYDYHGRNSDLPLYLAADVDYHDRFQKTSHNPRLQKQGVRINPDAVEVDTERLRQEMEHIIRPATDKEISDLVEQFGTARSKQLGSDDVKKVAEAVATGRVGTLLLDADKRMGGRLDMESGRILKADESDPAVDDVLDDLAEQVLRTGGVVRIIPSAVHPSPTGVAAIFRY